MTTSLALSRHDAVIDRNRQEYSAIYDELPFVGANAAISSMQLREQLLAEIARSGHSSNNGSKIYSGELSPGCKKCSEGVWSCLFINGKCNRSCFYCPTSQDDIGLPTTNNVTFRSPADYVAYLEQFNFSGMSLSGGEPTLTPGRCVAFLNAAKKKLGGSLHTWLYTNGSLIDRDLLLRLRDAGLDEIRFDIGALDYYLDKAALAVDIIPTVTVEIPAIPEKLELLKEKIIQMEDLGMKHLNLHQLRLTNYNSKRLKGRPYTYLHGEKVTVLESELIALELIRFGLEQKIHLGINYCSFVYKNRYQRAAARPRAAALFQQPWEVVTAAGYLRSLQLQGEPAALKRSIDQLEKHDPMKNFWQVSRKQDQLNFAPQLADYIAVEGCNLYVTYSETPVRQNMSYRSPFKEIKLPSGRKICGEKVQIKHMTLTSPEATIFLDWINNNHGTELLLQNSNLSSLADYEQLSPGLQEYF